jgi:hypothetical protein
MTTITRLQEQFALIQEQFNTLCVMLGPDIAWLTVSIPLCFRYSISCEYDHEHPNDGDILVHSEKEMLDILQFLSTVENVSRMITKLNISFICSAGLESLHCMNWFQPVKALNIKTSVFIADFALSQFPYRHLNIVSNERTSGLVQVNLQKHVDAPNPVPPVQLLLSSRLNNESEIEEQIRKLQVDINNARRRARRSQQYRNLAKKLSKQLVILKLRLERSREALSVEFDRLGGTRMFNLLSLINTTQMEQEGIQMYPVMTETSNGRPVYLLFQDGNVEIHALAAHFCELTNLSEASRRAIFTTLMADQLPPDVIEQVDFKSAQIGDIMAGLTRTMSTTGDNTELLRSYTATLRTVSGF